MLLPQIHILDDVLTTWGHIAVLRVIARSRNGQSGRALAREAGMTHRAALQSLARLSNLEIIKRERKGRAYLFKLNPDHTFVRSMLPSLLEYEEMFLPSAVKHIRKSLSSFVESVILRQLSGSARSRAIVEIELCIVVHDSGAEHGLMPLLPLLMDQVRTSYGIRLLPIMVTEEEFRQHARRQPQSTFPFIREGTVIAGKTIRELLR